MSFHLIHIDSEKNLLLTSPSLVGANELVEVYAPDQDTPQQTGGKLLRKIEDPNVFVVQDEFVEKSKNPLIPHGEIAQNCPQYLLGEKCVLRVMLKTLSGIRRRRFSKQEKVIVNLEHDESRAAVQEKRVVKAKTGSIRKKKKKA